MENIESYIGHNKNVVQIFETENGFIVVKKSYPRRVRLAHSSEEAGATAKTFLDEKDEAQKGGGVLSATVGRGN